MLKKSLLTAGTILMAGTAAILGPQSAEAISFGTYELQGHEDGNWFKNGTSPQYGFILNKLFKEYGDDGVATFSFDHGDSDMKLRYYEDEDGNKKINIFGQAYGGKASGGNYIDVDTGTDDYGVIAPGLWEIDMTYNIDTVGTSQDGQGDSLWAKPGGEAAGNGTITYLGDIPGDKTLSFDLKPKQKTKNLALEDRYSFAIDTGHRGETGYSGWGWVERTNENDAYVYNAPQDFLFVVGPEVEDFNANNDSVDIPEPATMSLLSLGLVGLGMGALKRKKG